MNRGAASVADDVLEPENRTEILVVDQAQVVTFAGIVGEFADEHLLPVGSLLSVRRAQRVAVERELLGHVVPPPE